MREDKESLCRLWLAFSEGVSPRAKAVLLVTHGSYAEVFERFPHSCTGILSDKTIEELGRIKAFGLDRMLMRLEELEIQVSFLSDADTYPKLLADIPDPPDVLFYRGILKADEPRAIAIVGSRRETRYGRQHAKDIARGLARENVLVVSGLARGIDTAAHEGALEGQGRTIAVLGSGLSRIYPEENKPLAEKIIMSGGAVISELPPNTQPLAYHLPNRNRIVSGLSRGLLLVEAREKSGTLITVTHALEQGREVFALPGEVDSPGSLIPHRMIREGARLCTCAGDILEDMGWQAPCGEAEQQTELSLDELTPAQQAVCEALKDDSRGFDELLALTKLDSAQLSTEITMLEMDGLILSLPGRQFKLAKRPPR